MSATAPSASPLGQAEKLAGTIFNKTGTWQDRVNRNLDNFAKPESAGDPNTIKEHFKSVFGPIFVGNIVAGTKLGINTLFLPIHPFKSVWGIIRSIGSMAMSQLAGVTNALALPTRLIDIAVKNMGTGLDNHGWGKTATVAKVAGAGTGMVNFLPDQAGKGAYAAYKAII